MIANSRDVLSRAFSIRRIEFFTRTATRHTWTDEEESLAREVAVALPDRWRGTGEILPRAGGKGRNRKTPSGELPEMFTLPFSFLSKRVDETL